MPRETAPSQESHHEALRTRVKCPKLGTWEVEAADCLEQEATVGQGPGTTSGGTRLEPELWGRVKGAPRRP